jgi:UPF0755 protein
VRKLALAVLPLVGLLAALAWFWVDRPLTLAQTPTDLLVEPGAGAAQVAREVAAAGVGVSAPLLQAWFRLSGDGRAIKAGSYEIEAGVTPRTLLRKLVRGEQATRSLTLVEGWNIRQVRQALAKAPNLAQQTAGLSDTQLMERLGRPGQHPEGRFFPDTYVYPKNSPDLVVLGLALRAMDRELAAAWTRRKPDTPLKTAEQMLVLGSIVEKETGRAADRPQIAAVFINRLRLGMLLQTDPSVIYGLGERFDGNLRKRDLQTDTPWNTYTRPGLPPTPIAMPGRAALQAVAEPAPSDALYFVARGDGSSEFSRSLADHNRAVRRFQLKAP